MGLPTPYKDDADTIDDIYERLRRLGADVGDDGEWFDLTNYMAQGRYRDTAYVGTDNEYGWFGWSAVDGTFFDNYVGTGAEAWCGLYKAGDVVYPFGNAYFQCFPWDRTDPDRFQLVDFNTGAVYASWGSMTVEDRIAIAMTILASLWAPYDIPYHYAHPTLAISAFPDDRVLPDRFKPWPSGQIHRLPVDRHNSTPWVRGVSFEFFFQTNGFTPVVNIKDADGRLVLPGDFDALSGVDQSKPLLQDGPFEPYSEWQGGLGFFDGFIALESLGPYPVYPDRTSPVANFNPEYIN